MNAPLATSVNVQKVAERLNAVIYTPDGCAYKLMNGCWEYVASVRTYDQGHPPVVRYLIASIPAIQLKTYAQTYYINSFPKGSVMFDLAQDRLISYKNAIAWIPGDELES